MSLALGTCVTLAAMLFGIAFQYNSGAWWTWPLVAAILLAAAWGLLERDFLARSKAEYKNRVRVFFKAGSWAICFLLFVYSYGLGADKWARSVSLAFGFVCSVVVFKVLFELFSFENHER